MPRGKTSTGLYPADPDPQFLRHLQFPNPNRCWPRTKSLLNGSRVLIPEPSDCIPIPTHIRKINGFVNVSVASIPKEVEPVGQLSAKSHALGPQLRVQSAAAQLQSVSDRMRKIKALKLRCFQKETQRRVARVARIKGAERTAKVRAIEGRMRKVISGSKLYTTEPEVEPMSTSTLVVRADAARDAVSSAYGDLAALAQGGTAPPPAGPLIVTTATNRAPAASVKAPKLASWNRGLAPDIRLTPGEAAEVSGMIRRLGMQDERAAIRAKRNRGNELVVELRASNANAEGREMLITPPDDGEGLDGGSGPAAAPGPTEAELQKMREAEQKRKKREIKKQRQAASKRYITAMLRELKAELKRRGIEAPKPCACELVNFFDPATHAEHENNCPFHQNPKKYVKACIQMLKGYKLSGNILKALESM